MGWVGYCLDDEQLTFDARERAYRLYRERGDPGAAARMAAWLAAVCLEFRGEPAVDKSAVRSVVFVQLAYECEPPLAVVLGIGSVFVSGT